MFNPNLKPWLTRSQPCDIAAIKQRSILKDSIVINLRLYKGKLLNL